jgi:hypothetical protein
VTLGVLADVDAALAVAVGVADDVTTVGGAGLAVAVGVPDAVGAADGLAVAVTVAVATGPPPATVTLPRMKACMAQK